MRSYTAAAVVIVALFVACSGGADPESNPETEENGFTRAASQFIAAVRDRDAGAYRSLLPPGERPPADRIEDAFDSVDLAGCDGSGAEFQMAEGNGGVYVDVVFDEPCGDFGVTDACNLWYRRSDGDWWVAQWSCSTSLPQATPDIS